MRPLSLGIEGFTAFRDRQDIDFEALDLFVITGPTGAGKTSILDAIVFALYGQVPRLGGRHGTADLISLGQAQARVQFEFSVAGKGCFRVARRLSRRGPQTATLERREGDEWVAVLERGGVRECNATLEQVLILDYDAFCKAVVLPQGEFHRFLKGDAKERRDLLVSLLGVGYFQRMAQLARERAAKLTTAVERTVEILDEQYAEATEAEVVRLGEAADLAEARHAQLIGGLTAASAHDAEAMVHRGRASALDTCRQELAALADELVAGIERCRKAEQRKTEASSAIAEATTLLEARRSVVIASDSDLASLEQRHGDAGRLADVANAAAMASTIALEEDAAEEADQAAEEKLAEAAEAVEAATADDETAQAQLRDAQSGERKADDAAQAARQAAETMVEHARRATDRVRELDGAQTGVATAGEAADAAATAAERAREELESRVAEHEHQRRAHAVAEIAAGVTVGDPCPVCTIPLTDAITVDSQVGALLEGARAAEGRARTADDVAGRAAARCAGDVEAARARVTEYEQRLRDELADRDDLAALRADAEEAATHATTVAGALAEARTVRATRELAARGAGERLATARAAQSGARAARESAHARLDDLRQRKAGAADVLRGYFGEIVPPDAAKELAARKTALETAVQGARAARTELDAATAQSDAARVQERDADALLAGVDVELAGLRTSAGAAQVAAGFALGDAGTAPAPPAAGGARDVSAAQLAGWCTALAATLVGAGDAAREGHIVAARKVVAIGAGLGAEASEGQAMLAWLRKTERVVGGEASRARYAVEVGFERAAERASMESRIGDEREQITVLSALAQDLRADRFGEYILQETLDLLADRASEELLRISDGRYSLVQRDGDFHVVDHANADEQRSVKTLSGGETFLASLALALALSRHVGELATEGLGAKLEAVFIDEGFGTLDPGALGDVIDALERLRAEELLVGVISHVPELAERLGTGLEVRKEEGRSRIVQHSGRHTR